MKKEFGKYQILGLLGSGANGVVYRARHENLNRTVALKLLKKSADSLTFERFNRESRIQAAISHPNLVRVWEAGTLDDQPFIALEYLAGGTLKNLLGEEAIEVSRVRTLARDLIDGLSALHELGIIHRDLKPANVMIGDSGEMKIADFGLARMSNQTQLTEAFEIVGTIPYLAPELIEEGEVSTWSDIYSLGAMIYLMLTAHLPVEPDVLPATGEPSTQLGDWMVAIIEKTPRPITDFNPACPPEVAEMVMKCLSKRPEERPTLSEMTQGFSLSLTGLMSMSSLPDPPNTSAIAESIMIVPERRRWLVTILPLFIGVLLGSMWKLSSSGESGRVTAAASGSSNSRPPSPVGIPPARQPLSSMRPLQRDVISGYLRRFKNLAPPVAMIDPRDENPARSEFEKMLRTGLFGSMDGPYHRGFAILFSTKDLVRLSVRVNGVLAAGKPPRFVVVNGKVLDERVTAEWLKGSHDLPGTLFVPGLNVIEITPRHNEDRITNLSISPRYSSPPDPGSGGSDELEPQLAGKIDSLLAQTREGRHLGTVYVLQELAVDHPKEPRVIQALCDVRITVASIIGSFDPYQTGIVEAFGSGLRREDDNAEVSGSRMLTGAILHMLARIRAQPLDPLAWATLGRGLSLAGLLDLGGRTAEYGVLLAPNDYQAWQQLALLLEFEMFAERLSQVGLSGLGDVISIMRDLCNDGTRLAGVLKDDYANRVLKGVRERLH